MDLGLELDGQAELSARLAHAQTGLLDLSSDLAAELTQTAPPMLVAGSVTMRARTWGAGDVWTLPAGGWITPRVQLPDNPDTLARHVQDLLDGH